MTVTLAPIKPIMRIEDVCELLGIQKTKFYELKAEGWFGSKGPALVEVLPPIDRAPRYAGGSFAEWLGDRNQARLLREQMKELA